MTKETLELATEMFNYLIKANEQIVTDGKSAMENDSLDITELSEATGRIQGKAQILTEVAELLQKFINQ